MHCFKISNFRIPIIIFHYFQSFSIQSIFSILETKQFFFSVWESKLQSFKSNPYKHSYRDSRILFILNFHSFCMKICVRNVVWIAEEDCEQRSCIVRWFVSWNVYSWVSPKKFVCDSCLWLVNAPKTSSIVSQTNV